MTEEQARTVKPGDKVLFRGKLVTVASVHHKPAIAAPHFVCYDDDGNRIPSEAEGGGLFSHQLFSLPKQ